MSVGLSISVSVCLFVCPFVCQCVYLSVRLSVKSESLDARPAGNLRLITSSRNFKTGVIIVLFVVLVGNLGYKCRPNKQLTTDFPAHKNVKVSFFVQLL